MVKIIFKNLSFAIEYIKTDMIKAIYYIRP